MQFAVQHGNFEIRWYLPVSALKIGTHLPSPNGVTVETFGAELSAIANREDQ